MFKQGRKVVTPYGEGILDSRDQTSTNWLVKYPDGFQEFLSEDAIGPHPKEGSVEAVDVNGDHWYVIPPQDGSGLWTLEPIETEVKAQKKAKKDG